MIVNIQKIRDYFWLALILWLSASMVLLIATSFLLEAYLDQTFQAAVLIAGTGVLLINIFVAVWVAKKLIFGLNYLASAVLSVASDTSHVDPPDPNTLSKKYHFLNDLAGHVYRMAGSTNSQADAQTGSIPNLAQLAVPAVAVSAEGKIVYANAASGAYFSFDQVQAIEKQIDEVFNFSFSGSDQTLDDWIAYCKDNKATASQSWDHVKHTLSDDSNRQFDMVGHYSKDSTNGYDFLLIFIDHTDRYDQEYRDVSFVAMAVHELRTPLTVMRGYLEVFEDELGESLNEEQHEFLANMNAQGQQLANFVSNILNVARVEENQLHVKMRKENWADIIRKTVTDMELRARVRGLKINYTLPETLPEVAVDKVSMYEVLNNLLDNAIKYTHDDKPITLEVKVVDDSWIETSITDQGVGIPDNVMKHLFKKFYRSYRSNKTAVGTGLGLFISKSLVNAQGGEIWAKSKEGFGSTFGFTVPTHASVADKLGSEDNEITREAHGWIKNHSMYRG